MKKKGGYIIIDLQSASIVNDLAKALDSNKPVLVYDANNDANFYTLAYDSDNNIYTLTGADNKIAVASDGTITTGDNIPVSIIDLGDLASSADDIDTISNFDSLIITKELYDKITSGLYPIKAKLYDDVYFIGYPNLLTDNNNIIFNNALIDTKYLMYYYDTTDNAMGILVIGQLKDERYFVVCSNVTNVIINA